MCYLPKGQRVDIQSASSRRKERSQERGYDAPAFGYRADAHCPAVWQQRVVTTYIEAHLSETIPMAKLAELDRLSPYYFCRAFKQSFGLPPHRYHNSRRIEHAKTLLAKSSPSVTDIGLTVGFSETSSFTAAFRKATGLTPTTYHRWRKPGAAFGAGNAAARRRT